MKKYISLIISITLFCAYISIGTVQALGSTPPEIAISQLTGSRPAGATEKLDYDLCTYLGEKPMAWDSDYTNFSYVSQSLLKGYYKFSKVSGGTSYFFSPTSKVFDVKPNRNYLISALVYCDFDRANSEVNMGIRTGAGADITTGDPKGEGRTTLIDGFHGLPATTNGQWLRFETTVTTPPEAKKGRFYGAWYGFEDPNEVFCIADMEVIELPEETLKPLGVGEGLVFGGSSGMYDMKVETPSVTSSSVTVRTNGAEYIFDKNSSIITVNQRIGNPRTLATIQLDRALTNLQVSGTPTQKEAILTTGDGGLSFGIQMDGMMLISTHGSDATFTLTSQIGGKWNRLLNGNLIASDDTGGFTVNPAIPLGTGRLARCNVISGVDFEKERGDTTFLSSAQPGWSVSWTISSGERLGVTAFPPREYDWENSFDTIVANIDFEKGYSEERGAWQWQNYKTAIDLDYGIIWGAFQGAYGMSFGTQSIPKDEDIFKAHVEAANAAGVEPLEYISMFFWDGTMDEYIAEVIRHRDTYGIRGVYTDGVPPIDWLESYEGMRRLREVFPDGCIIVHTTGQTANGGAPLATPEVFIPALDAYATFTLRGESVEGTTKDWPYPRFVTSGYGTSNVFGLQKFDGWEIDGGGMPVHEQQLLQLLHNGRARYDGTYSRGYREILAKVQKLWEANGWSDEFYENCYLPYVRRNVREEHAKLVSEGKITEYAAVKVLDENFESDSIWNSLPNTAVLENSSLKIEPGKSSEGDFLPSYGKTEISFKVKLSALSQGKINITDMHGKTAISLMQTGSVLRYLDRKGGYAVLCDIAADSFIDITISADPATGKYDLSVNGVSILTEKPFSIQIAELSRIKFSNNASTIFVDDLSVSSGM